jgi:peptide/nickel transport system substrate-binding protein
MPDPEDALRRLFDEKVRDLGRSAEPPSSRVMRRIRVRQVTAAFTAIVTVAGLALAGFAGLRQLTGMPKPIVAPTPVPTTRAGGSITVGTSEFPECLNPITACASATGTWWTVLEQVMPRAMELDADADVVPSTLLVEAPSLENGGLTEGPFTITYHLNPEARWADGTPVTAADFDFTWRAIMHTTGAYQTTGYDQITSIDATDPTTVVVRFKAVVADWPDLFGGAFGGVLEKAAFPHFLHDPSPDLQNEMQTDIPFSAGPWILDSFTAAKIVLVPNARYVGTVPKLDRVTIVPVTDTTAAVQMLRDGTVDAVPWSADQVFLDQLSGQTNLQVVSGGGAYFEALWFNHDAVPLDDPSVREALMYAIDRQAVIDQVVRPLNPGAEVLNCGFLALPNVGPWCRSTPFAQFTYDPAHAKQILEADGYDCSSLPCTKGGRRLAIDYATVSTNERRLQTQQLLQDQALQAGFELRFRNDDAGILFGDRLPHGDFGMADYASGGTADPSVTFTLACDGIPTQANGYSGGNWNRWCDREATDLMRQSDVELDPEKRLDLMDRIYAIEAQDFLSLPLYVLPEMAAWRTDRVAGPVGTYAGTLMGLFFNLNEWSAVQP